MMTLPESAGRRSCPASECVKRTDNGSTSDRRRGAGEEDQRQCTPVGEGVKGTTAWLRDSVSMLRHRAAAERRRNAPGVWTRPRRLGRRAERRPSGRFSLCRQSTGA